MPAECGGEPQNDVSDAHRLLKQFIRLAQGALTLRNALALLIMASVRGGTPLLAVQHACVEIRTIYHSTTQLYHIICTIVCRLLHGCGAVDRPLSATPHMHRVHSQSKW